MPNRELVQTPSPYKFTLDGSIKIKGITTDYTHVNYRGMDFLNFKYLGLSDTSNDYVWMGLNYEVTLAATPNAPFFVGSGLDDLTSGGTYTGTTNQNIVIAIKNASSSPETYKVSLDNGASYHGVNEPLYVASTSAGDTTQTLTVNGLDANLTAQTATQVLAGQTKTVIDNVSTEWRQVTSIELDAVSAGTVSVFSDDTVTAGVPDNFLTTLIIGLNAGETRLAQTLPTLGIDCATGAVAVTGGNGLTVTFGATTGHSADLWLISTLGAAHYGEDILKAWEVA